MSKVETTRIVRDETGQIKETITHKTTEIVVLLDRSGSMGSIKRDTELGFDAFVESQKSGSGRCNLTLVQFDTQGIETVYEGTPIKHVSKLILSPRGGTPLLDAIGEVVGDTKHRLLKSRNRVDQVVFVIVTDGEENSSKHYTKSQVNSIISQAKNDLDWEFVYLGANQDAIQEGAGIGVTHSFNYLASPIHTERMWSNMGKVIGTYRSSNVMAMSADMSAALISDTAPGYTKG